MTSQETFEKWLDEYVDVLGMTRRQFSIDIHCSIEDLEWAFCSGYDKGKMDELERK